MEHRDLLSERSLFITCIVSLQLVGKDGSQNQRVIWTNPKPSSTIYCRPIRFKYVKDTTEVLRTEEAYLDSTKANLSETVISEKLSVSRTIDLTMIDGKVATVLSTVTNSSQCCSLCGASPKQMNNLDEVSKRPYTGEGLKHGLSTLHAWIRCMECLLHISYKSTIKKWQLKVR